MDKGAVDNTEWSEKGKNMLLFRVLHCLPLLVVTCWAVLHGVDGTCVSGVDCQNEGTCESNTCVCDGTGYDGTTCENDIDECNDGTDNCHENADCSNTVGSFTCKCKDGHVGNGVECESTVCTADGNECLNGGTCNIPSGGTAGTCSCESGYSGPLCEDASGAATISVHFLLLIVVAVLATLCLN